MNLIRNPDEPLEALALTQRLLALDEQGIPPESTAIDIGGNNWGSVMSVPQSNLTSGAWSYSALVQTELASAETRRCSPDASFVDRLHVAELKSLADLGPYHIQVKNPDQGLFSIVETREILRAGIPALWHHKSTYNITLEATADSRLERRTDRDRAEQDRMLERRRKLHMALELRMAPQRVAAVITDTPMLGVRSWVTILLHDPTPGKEEALCLWLNSTPGLLMRVLHGNRPYLGRSAITHELAQTMPVLDVSKLEEKHLRASVKIYNDLKRQPLQGFTSIAIDPVRRELNERFAREVLDVDPKLVESLTRKLALEPTLHVRH